MTELDVPQQPGTPSFLVDEIATPQPTSDTMLASSDHTSSESDKLKVALLNDPSDYKSWLKLIQITEETDKIDDINKVFDDCLKIFPEDDIIWSKYAEYHLNKENRSKVEEIFKSCINMKSLKLWELYLNKFVVKYNSLIGGGRQALGNIIKAHEFALVDVGLDIDADILYEHEISIVSSFNAINEDQNAEKKKIILQILRKAIKLPTKKIQLFWNQYIELCPKSEIQINSADYFKVKTFVNLLIRAIEGLDRSYIQTEKRIDSVALKQLAIYHKWIAFEKENKLALPADLLSKRIEYVYILSLRALRFVPELWIEYSQVKASIPVLPTDKVNHLLQVLNTGFAANGTSFAILFSIAESYELDGKFTEAKQTYENLITSLTKLYEINKLEVEKLKELQLEETKQQELALKIRRKIEIENKNEDDDDDMGEKLVTQLLLPQITNLKGSYYYNSQLEKLERENDDYGTAISLAYCTYMRFAKRNLEFDETRQLFKKVKKFAGHSWHIYSTSAQIEMEHNNKKVATKVYELAMKRTKFQKNIEFIIDYLRFLVKIDDRTNAKALFETSVKNFDTEESSLKILYLEYIRIENESQSDINTIKTLETRFLKRFTNTKLIDALEERFKVVDFDPIKKFDFYGGSYLMNGVENAKKRKLDQEPVDEMDIDEQGENNEEDSGPVEPFVEDEIYSLLRILPKPSYCQPSMFNEKNLVNFLKNLDQ